MSWDYGTLATEVYELDKPIGHSFGDVEYYLELLREVGDPICEPAVGTGRILIPLLEAGLEVEGLDTSAEMLAVCRQHCRERGLDPVLREADMTSFVRPEAYGAVIIPAGSIALLDGHLATMAALRCFQQSLMPGGKLVVDVDAPSLARAAEPMRHWRRGPDLWTLQVMHVEYDPVANQTTRFLRYDKWRDGALVASELQPFRLQHWNLREFESLLREAEFTDIVVAADYQDRGEIGPGTGVWTFQATRP